MELAAKSRSFRWLLVIFELAVFLVAATWIVKTYVAYELSESPSVKNLELAVKLDPKSAEDHLKLGRLYEYGMADIDPQKAQEHLRRATELDSYDPEGWLELGAAMEFQGNVSEAETCLRRADFLAPNLTAYQWPLANFFLLQGDIDEAFRHFKVVLAGTAQYDQIVFRTAWKASDDPAKILDELIPRSAPTEFSYIFYLVSQQRFTEAQAVWKRIVHSSEKLNTQQSFAYIDQLIVNRLPEEAYEVWSDLGRKGLLRNAVQGTGENLVTNGDFEDELLNTGFDWRIIPVEGVYAGLDQRTFRSPNHALLVEFSGKQNLDYRQVYELVKVSPSCSYQLQAFSKTDGMTTNSGPRLEVRDYYDPATLDKFSEDLTGSTPSWTPLTLDFKTGPKTELIVVTVARLPSQKLDNQVAGKVWLDDVRLKRQTE